MCLLCRFEDTQNSSSIPTNAINSFVLHHWKGHGKLLCFMRWDERY